MVRLRSRSILVLIALLFSAFPLENTFAQTNAHNKPVDLMVLLDNSCSMFVANKAGADCDMTDTDPSQYRITGINLLLARLGINQPDEDQYRFGLVTYGATPALVQPLAPIAELRDSLAKTISVPQVEPDAQLLPALQMAYQQLDEGAKSEVAHLPAMLIITDGLSSKSDRDQIVSMLNAHPETLVYVLLIQNKATDPGLLGEEVNFWQTADLANGQVEISLIEDPAQLIRASNAIVDQLMNATSEKQVVVNGGGVQKFTIGPYADQTIITVIRNSRNPVTVTITDPSGKTVNTSEEGVDYFRGKENNVEVYSLQIPRVTDELRNGTWTITSNAQTTLLMDWIGTYRFDLLEPVADITRLPGQFISKNRQQPAQILSLRFQLLDRLGQVVLGPQKISGEIIGPTGNAVKLALEAIKPDNSGVYEIQYDILAAFPDLANNPGRFTISLTAGEANPGQAVIAPVAKMSLTMDIGQTPYIRSIAPLPVVCEAGQPSEIRVNLGDFSSSQQDSLKVRIYLGDATLDLTQTDPGVFSGDLMSVCGQALAKMACSQTTNETIKVELNANLKDGAILSPVYREVQTQYKTSQCTPTPLPTATLTPTPTPTPVPDTDHDGIQDSLDACPDQPGLPGDQGCFPVGRVAGYGGILVALLIAGIWLEPVIRVHTYAPPPNGFIKIVTRDNPGGEIIDLFQLGRRRRKNRIAVGSDWKRTQVTLSGIKPVEFIIERKNILTVLRDPDEEQPFAFLDASLQRIRTSDPDVIILVSMNRDALEG